MGQETNLKRLARWLAWIAAYILEENEGHAEPFVEGLEMAEAIIAEMLMEARRNGD